MIRWMARACITVTCLAASVRGLADGAIPHPLVAAYVHPERVISREGTDIEQSTAIRSTLDRMRKSGINAIYPYFTGSSGQAFYASRILAERVYGERDPLGLLLSEARQRGIEVYPVVCVTVCGNEKPAGILLKQADWALRHPDGSALGYISPAHPAAREWLVSIAREIVEKYQPDGIILDYIRYHNRPLKLDASSEARFLAGRSADASPADEETRLQRFKEDELTELVRLYRETTQQARSATRLGIYTWGPHAAAGHRIAQCWPRWVKSGYLDMVNVSGYYHRDKYGERYLAMFEEKMRQAVALNQGTGRPVPLSFALGVETSHGKVHSAEDILVYLRKAADVKLNGVVFFTWNTLLPYLDALDEQGPLWPAR